MISLFSKTLNTPLQPSQIACKTNTGLVRKHNEDGFLSICLPENDTSLFVVADGMGGHDGGEMASYITTNTIKRIWLQANQKENKHEFLTQGLLLEAIKLSNQKVFKINQNLKIKKVMGTTITTGLFSPGLLQIAHVGDSRCYSWRKNKLQLLTDDQTWVTKMIKLGRITPKQAKNHALAHLLSNCLGVYENLHVETYTFERKKNTRYLFCSDGLHGEVPDNIIQNIFKTSSSPQKCMDNFMEKSLKNGGRDNITGIVIFDD